MNDDCKPILTDDGKEANIRIERRHAFVPKGSGKVTLMLPDASWPKYTREELVDIIEVPTKRMLEVSRRLAIVDFQEADLKKHSSIIANDTINALIEAGALTVRESE
jgi:hypothetical protein